VSTPQSSDEIENKGGVLFDKWVNHQELAAALAAIPAQPPASSQSLAASQNYGVNNNATAEVTVMSAALPALATGDVVRVRCSVLFYNQTGSPYNAAIRVKSSATTDLTTTYQETIANATLSTVYFDVDLTVTGAGGANAVGRSSRVVGQPAATGNPIAASSGHFANTANTLNAPSTLSVTLQTGVNNANSMALLRIGSIELLKKAS
jgi:hypothetical protein